jgi:hypothetical protein
MNAELLFILMHNSYFWKKLNDRIRSPVSLIVYITAFLFQMTAFEYHLAELVCIDV